VNLKIIGGFIAALDKQPVVKGTVLLTTHNSSVRETVLPTTADGDQNVSKDPISGQYPSRYISTHIEAGQ
jgi:hypothetical protein